MITLDPSLFFRLCFFHSPIRILNSQDPTIPVVDEYLESTMLRILEQVEVYTDHLGIKFRGVDAVDVASYSHTASQSSLSL